MERKMALWLVVSAGMSLGLLGCGGGRPTEMADAATPPMDDTGTGPLCARIPTTGFGSSEGRKLANFTLPQCDDTPYSFYDDTFCAPEHTLTVLSIAAEWCGPCQVESSMLTDRISRPYADRGVRVIQIIVQNASYGPPDAGLCSRWVSRFNLTDNVEVYDPSGMTAAAFPTGALPSTLIIDETGTIIYREDGVSDGLVTIRAELDRALAGR